MIEKTLYIIGNGFDLYHWNETETFPHTGYGYFGCFLKKNYTECFDWLIRACNLPCDPLFTLTEGADWSKFEEALANFDGDEIWDHAQNYMDDSDPHRSGEASWEAERIVDDITQGMRKAFIHFLSELPYPENISSVHLPIRSESLFLSFNYTNTLERYYGVNPANICYIHGKASSDEDLQIGHGVHPSEFERQEVESSPPQGLSAEQTEMWRDEMSNQYSLSSELTNDEIDCYWTSSFKDTETNITERQTFFEMCDGIERVIIMGHSLSDVDLPYFEKIKNTVLSNAHWDISYHNSGDEEKFIKTLLQFGITSSKISTFELKTLAESSHLTL